MNTVTHLAIGGVLYGRRGKPRRLLWALAGALLPDFFIFVLFFYALFAGIPEDVLWGQLYYSEGWTLIFSASNSIFLYGPLFLVGLWRYSDTLGPLGGAGLAHIALDLPVHHDDGHAHFWPLSDWVYESPLSYWDPGQYGSYVGAFDALLALGAGFILASRYGTRRWHWVVFIVIISLILGFFFLPPFIFFW